MNITTFDNKNLKELRAEINDALISVGKRHGITLDIGNIKYDAKTFTTKMTAVAVGDGDINDADRIMWNKYCYKFNLKKEDFGRKFTANGKEYTICGIKQASYKYPVLAKDYGGQIYKFPVVAIK